MMVKQMRYALVVAFWLPIACGSGEAQGDGPYVPAPVSRASASSEDELVRLRKRMERYEYELGQLRGQLDQLGGPRLERPGNPRSGWGARTPTGHGTFDDDGAGGVKIEKVEVQTRPNHKLRGRLFFDHVMFDDDDALGLDRQNETGFDTARMGMEGNIVENVAYQIEVEFEGTEVDFKTVFIEATQLPWLGRFRAGHFYEPIAGLDEDSGSRYQMFMERSTAVTTFIPSRSFGYMVHRTLMNDDLYLAAGTFRHTSDDSPDRRGTILGDDGDWVFTGRVAWNPYYDELTDGRYVVHLGLGYSYRTDPEGVQFDTISELGNQAGFLEATVPGEEDFSLITPEVLVIWGPWSVQSEPIFVPAGPADFWSMYVEASYFFKGHRGYRRSDKTLSNPVLLEDFFRVRSPLGICSGSGAWELKTRWSHVDLRDGAGPDRGLRNSWSAGVNWYLNRYTRVMFDYVYGDVDLLTGATGHNHSFGTRFQVHW